MTHPYPHDNAEIGGTNPSIIGTSPIDRADALNVPARPTEQSRTVSSVPTTSVNDLDCPLQPGSHQFIFPPTATMPVESSQSDLEPFSPPILPQVQSVEAFPTLPPDLSLAPSLSSQPDIERKRRRHPSPIDTSSREPAGDSDVDRMAPRARRDRAYSVPLSTSITRTDQHHSLPPVLSSAQNAGAALPVLPQAGIRGGFLEASHLGLQPVDTSLFPQEWRSNFSSTSIATGATSTQSLLSLPGSAPPDASFIDPSFDFLFQAPSSTLGGVFQDTWQLNGSAQGTSSYAEAPASSNSSLAQCRTALHSNLVDASEAPWASQALHSRRERAPRLSSLPQAQSLSRAGSYEDLMQGVGQALPMSEVGSIPPSPQSIGSYESVIDLSYRAASGPFSAHQPAQLAARDVSGPDASTLLAQCRAIIANASQPQTGHSYGASGRPVAAASTSRGKLVPTNHGATATMRRIFELLEIPEHLFHSRENLHHVEQSIAEMRDNLEGAVQERDRLREQFDTLSTLLYNLEQRIREGAGPSWLSNSQAHVGSGRAGPSARGTSRPRRDSWRQLR
ncbi:hypothetical protein BC834DRAFT_163908 [Gloeopeniophorella convolvens]|nr:hypothetical protein BC834DRAFT_163908 [Gloeopeniophorella convolvens]